jgi:hypothetical protein
LGGGRIVFSMRTLLTWSLLLGMGCLAPDQIPLLDAGSRPGLCGPDTCRGCCSDGVCVSGYVDDACGLLGHKCSVCPVDRHCSASRQCELPRREDSNDDGPPPIYAQPAGDPVPPGTDPPPHCYTGTGCH